MKVFNSVNSIKHRVLSGVQPTGIPTLGNFLGAFQQFKQLQNLPNKSLNPSLFMIVDLHSLTSPTTLPNPNQMRENIFGLAASYIACGVDFNEKSRCFLFKQSDVLQHAHLMWILSCFTSLGELNRMTQYKSKQNDSSPSFLGLYSYPVLMAADILLYKADAVPVGDDQLQHLELARTLAIRFNKHVKKNLLIPPRPLQLSSGHVRRVMSLQDPLQKMSKSSPVEKSKIMLNDSADVIKKKISKAVTDTLGEVNESTMTGNDRPGVQNLINIYSALRHPDNPDAITLSLQELNGLDMMHLKQRVSDAVIETICPIGDEISRLMQDKEHLSTKLNEGRIKAEESAQKTISEVSQALGLQ